MPIHASKLIKGNDGLSCRLTTGYHLPALGYGASQLTDRYIAPCTRISIRLAFWGMGFSLWLRGVRYLNPSAIRYDRSIGKTGFSASRAIPQS